MIPILTALIEAPIQLLLFYIYLQILIKQIIKVAPQLRVVCYLSIIFILILMYYKATLEKKARLKFKND